MDNVILCKVCGNQNSQEERFCSNCRSRLSTDAMVTRQQADELNETRQAALKRRRIIRWGLVALVLVSLSVWIVFKYILPTPIPPPPTSDISSNSTHGNWSMYQRDPAHTAFVSDEDTPKGELKWRFETGSPIFSSPAVVDGRVYLSTGDSRILALDENSGVLLWEHEVTAPVNSSPAVAGDLVFVGLRDGRVLALRKDTGDFQWAFRTGGLIFSSPTVYKGTLYIGSGDERLYALDAMTGEERWNFETDGRVLSSPAVNQDVVAVTSQDGHLYILDIKTGKRRLDHLASAEGAPVFHENTVYIADSRGTVRAIDWRKRELPFEKSARWVRTQFFAWGLQNAPPIQKGLIWGFRQPKDSFTATPALAGDNLYIGSRGGTLLALDRSTGETVWTFRAAAGFTGSPSVLNQTVFVGDVDGRLYAIDSVSGQDIWVFNTRGQISSTPVIAGGVLYVTSWDGTLYAIE